MAETESTGRSNAWTDEAKIEFLLRIIMQLKPDGKGINWNGIQMPGRSVKSLQNQWTSVNKKIDVLRQQQHQDGVASAPATPSSSKKITAGRRRKVKKNDSEDDEDDGLGSTKKPGARKRRGNTDTPERAAKAVKKELGEAIIKGESEMEDYYYHGEA
ncbi:hypothetical protein NM208_g5806 [Fusarium decemcellulare]|uniref:Uncharacterized protein n=1 Tax=Fusarium decemcellulare TaxID=57161 RepID=A0ACC1SFI5_9HYPO|nr:hypothetical protein NM208_g5806 [Fusarium decemcellulare]